jgi:MFS family permease
MRNPLSAAGSVLRGYLALPKSVWTVTTGTFINMLGNFVGPFLTLILTDRAGLSPDQAGLYVTLSSIVALGGILLGGKLVDAVGRKSVLLVFSGLAVAAYVACAFALGNTVLLVALLMAFTLCNAIAQPVLNTILMDVTPPAQRQRAFSLQYLMLNAGFAVGPLLASFLYNDDLALMFVLDAATTLVSLLLVAAFVPESHPFRRARGSSVPGAPVSSPASVPAPAHAPGEAPVQGSLWSVLRIRPQLLFFIATSVVFFLVFSQFTFGLSLQAKHAFGDAGPTVFGLMMTVNGLGVVLFSVPAGHAFRKRDPLVSIAAGSLLYTAGFGMMAVVRTVPLFLAATAVWTLGEVLVSPSTNVYLAAHTPITHRGRFNAIFPIIRRLGFALGPALAGMYAAAHGITAVWIPTAILSLAAGGMTLYLFLWQRRSSEGSAAVSPPSDSVV